MFDPYPLVRPFLHRLDPEDAHEVTLRALEANLVPGQPRNDDPILATTLFGRVLSNPIGLAAGFDKNGRVYERMRAQGFGFVEVGGVTPRPQAGNPRPRVFRLPEDGAVINRMGFPNDGADVVEARLRAKGRPEGIGLGVNLASNADSPDPADDFVQLAQRFAHVADYLTLDVSCPNTANGQVFLDPARLADLLVRLAAVDWGPGRPALAAKLAPDVDDALLERLVATLLDAHIDAIIVANTTRARPSGLRGAHAAEAGGLSGAPLFAPSTLMLARVHALTGGRVPLIGVGGIASGADAYMKIRAGASAVQLYTGLIYAGTGLVTRIKRELAALLRRDGFASVEAAAAAT
ncbi:MAG: quinone-dependent dihydroorotate dehydrogenase [Candidatus Eremiobacteraeota bacterium]|nr:quinone-dependent dihydroorotate dehydrogenase [Candidatus Eremiobacteraeota bacterium]MBV9408769.1 quinone-dependent dihydroorotate dehydrogenase [Candidatus Eremiobacteraeota bacterium]